MSVGEPLVAGAAPGDGGTSRLTRSEGARPRLGSQLLSLSGGRVLGALAVASLYVVGARRLGVAEYATFVLLQALAGMFLVGTELGTTTMLADVVAQDRRRARAALRRVVRMRMPLVVPVWLVLTACLVAAAPGPTSRTIETAALFLPVIASSVATSSAVSTLRALGRAWVEGLETMLFRGAQLAVSWIWLVHGGGLDALVLVNAIVSAAEAAVVTSIAVTVAPTDAVPLPRHLLTLGRGRWLTAATLISTVYDRLDTWLLALMAVPLAVSVYASAYRVFGAVLLMANAVAALAIPSTAGHAGADLVRAGRRLIAWALVLTGPAVIVVLIGAPEVMRLLFGARYAGGAGALRVLMVAVVPSAVGAAIVPRAVLLDGPRITAYFVLSLLANVAIDVAAIPFLGALGAAMGTAVCQGAMSVVVWRRYQRAALRTAG